MTKPARAASIAITLAAATCSRQPPTPASVPTPALSEPRPVAAAPPAAAQPAAPQSWPEDELPSPVDPELLRAVGAMPEVAGWTLVPLAQLERPPRYVVVVWPAMQGSAVIRDDDIVAIPLERTQAGGMVPFGEPFLVGRGEQERVVQALGGSDYTTRARHEGVPLDELGPQVVARVRRFRDAVQQGDAQAIVAAAVGFSRLLSTERAALDDWVSDALTELVEENVTVEAVRTERPGQGGTARVVLRMKNGDDVDEEGVIATQAGDDRHWVISGEAD